MSNMILREFWGDQQVTMSLDLKYGPSIHIKRRFQGNQHAKRKESLDRSESIAATVFVCEFQSAEYFKWHNPT